MSETYWIIEGGNLLSGHSTKKEAMEYAEQRMNSGPMWSTPEMPYGWNPPDMLKIARVKMVATLRRPPPGKPEWVSD